MQGTEHRPDPTGDQPADQPVTRSRSSRRHPIGQHRRRRDYPGRLLPMACAVGLGLVVGVTVADRGAEPTAGRTALPPVVAVGEVPDTRTALPRSEPVYLDIRSIGVSSPLVELGLNADRTLEVPVDFSKPGWFTRGSYPGDPQGPPAIIAGHVDDVTGPAVFARLAVLGEGAEIVVVRADSSAVVFRVIGAQRFDKDEFPAEQVYAPVPSSELVLITCTGDFDDQARSYDDNLVVRAQLDLEASRALTAERAEAGLVAPTSDLPNV
jgi:hypothetical protein